MRKINNRIITLIAVVIGVFIFSGCQDFINDGNLEDRINSNGGYYYLIDNNRHAVIILDNNLRIESLGEARNNEAEGSQTENLLNKKMSYREIISFYEKELIEL